MVLAEVLADAHSVLSEAQTLTLIQLYFDSPETQLHAFELLAPEVAEWDHALTPMAKSFLKRALDSKELSPAARHLFPRSPAPRPAPSHPRRCRPSR